MGLILASGSPRRLELLSLLGITPHKVSPANTDETPHKHESVRQYVTRIALEKARAVHEAGHYTLGSDTMVEAGGRFFLQPTSWDDAKTQLDRLSGRRHRVYTALALMTPEGRTVTRVIVTRVTFKSLTPQEIDDYLKTNEWQGVAGSYRIQGGGAAFIKNINGSYHAVMGLPLYETSCLLKGLGYGG